MSRIVVVGAGLAGLRAAQAARAAGHDGELLLLGHEPHAPYTRPPLSKELLKGDQTPDQTAFPGLNKLDATLRLGTTVEGLDPTAHAVTLSGGETLAYDRLVIATGSRARTLPGAEAAHTLRGLDDAAALLAAIEDDGVKRVAIIGAGFIGSEVAASLRHRGIEVALVDVVDEPLTPIGPELGSRIADVHRAHGVELHLGVEVADVDDRGLSLRDGARIDADLVIVAVGAAPNTEWCTGIELADDGGVVCDATLTSVSDPDVLAAGDVVAWPHPGAGGERVRVEHWTTAAEQGKLAGANATREPADREAHTAPPYFWSDQYDVKIQVVGFPSRAASIEVVEEDAEADAPRLLAEALDAAGELVGAVAFNNARKLAEYRGRLVAGQA